MENPPQNPNPDGTDEPLSFVNRAMNLRNCDVEMTSVVQDPITYERSFCCRPFQFLQHVRAKEFLIKFLVLVYAVFLFLQFIGLGVAYLPRAIACCVKYNVSSYQCTSLGVLFHDELEPRLELCWITAQVMTGFLCCFVVCKWHGAEGVKLILCKLKKLPTFWRIIGMFTTSGCTMALMLDRTQTNITPLQTAILLVFGLQYLTMVMLVPLLNYTRIFAICRQKGYSRPIRVLVQLTIVLLFLVNFVLFFIGMLQLAFKVSGIDSSAKGSFEFSIVFLVIRQLTDVLFFKTVQSFFWIKLFCDNKNILPVPHGKSGASE